MRYRNFHDAGARSDPDAARPMKTLTGRQARLLVAALYVLAGSTFVLDLVGDDNLAYGIIYAPLVATAVLHKSRSGVWMLSAATCLMVVLGVFIPVINTDLPEMIGNRVLSVLAIMATAAFVQHARCIQERLAAETRRAEAAERIKTDVLNNLTEEIRPPLQTLLGVLTLTMAHSVPVQREVLGRVRADGTRLLATIDNLIDLTQIGELELRRQRVDIARIARDAAESARPAAQERQIDIAVNAEPGTSRASALGDSWAMRRILDNLLANAVRLTPPGGTVSVSVDRKAGTVTTSVSDTGRGFPPELVKEFNEDVPENDGRSLPEAGGTGLALSNRLARAMNGRLTAENQPGTGATIRLSLPAADQEAA
jgi:signal transduction histidine kinase